MGRIKGITHSRLDEIQAAILRVKLRYLDDELKTRQKIVNYYRRELASDFLIPSKVSDEVIHANHLFVIGIKDREKIRLKLKKAGIETAIHYPASVHLVTAFADLGYRRGDFPVSEAACEQVLSLPLYFGLSVINQNRIINAVLEFIKARPSAGRPGLIKI